MSRCRRLTACVYPLSVKRASVCPSCAAYTPHRPRRQSVATHTCAAAPAVTDARSGRCPVWPASRSPARRPQRSACAVRCCDCPGDPSSSRRQRRPALLPGRTVKVEGQLVSQRRRQVDDPDARIRLRRLDCQVSRTRSIDRRRSASASPIRRPARLARRASPAPYRRTGWASRPPRRAAPSVARARRTDAASVSH